jgi:mannose/fructose/N-acetylgalactosamine-specific phosphotransferase system component IIC
MISEHLLSEAGMWLLKAAALGALLAVDGQSLLHLVAGQPLVVGVLSGWALGDVGVGLEVGAYLQLVWSYGLPRGRVAGPDASSGTIAAVVVAAGCAPALSHGAGHLALALAVGIGVARLGVWAEGIRRRVNGRLWARALLRLGQGRRHSLAEAHALGLIVAAATGAITAGAGAGIGLSVASMAINLLGGMDFGAAFALIPCLGVASFVLSLVRTRRLELAGFAAGLAAALLIGLEFGFS